MTTLGSQLNDFLNEQAAPAPKETFEQVMALAHGRKQRAEANLFFEFLFEDFKIALQFKKKFDGRKLPTFMRKVADANDPLNMVLIDWQEKLAEHDLEIGFHEEHDGFGIEDWTVANIRPSIMSILKETK